MDGAFHVAIARHMHMYLCNVECLPVPMKQKFGRAYELRFQVHNNLRMPVKKVDIGEYQNTIDSLLDMLSPFVGNHPLRTAIP